MATATPWNLRAACLGAPEAIFFPTVGENDAYDISRPICQACPVRPDCLDWALATNQRFGMLGGLTPAERRAVRRDRRQEGQAS